MLKRMIVFILFLSVFTMHITAVSSRDFDIDIDNVINVIPDDVKEQLPSGVMDDGDAVSAADSVTFSSFLTFLGNLIKSTIDPITKNFSMLLSLIIICSVVNAVKNNISDESMMKTIGFITVIAVSVMSYEIIKDVWYSVEQYMNRMDVLIKSMLPVMTLLYTLGGNVATAVVNSSATAITLTIINVICQYILFPFLKILFGLALTSSLGGFKGIDGISKTARKIFTILLSGTVTVLSVFMLFKTNLAMSSDGVAARTIKFAGSFIPVIGSALGDSVRSVMSGLSLVKSSSGFVGIMTVLFITLPILLIIISNKISFDLIGGIADMLGCETEGKILKEFSSILSFALALTVTVSVLFIFELTIFINTSLALGGG